MLVVGEKMSVVQEVKDDLRSAFEIKDLRAARRILSMNIVRDIKKSVLWLTRSGYISRMLKRFKVENMREVSTPLAIHFKLFAAQRP